VSANGTWYLIGKVDGDGVIAESNESDNTKAATLLVGPDLQAKKLTVSPLSAPPGGSITVTLETINASKLPVPATVSRIYYSHDKKLATGTDTLLATINIAALAAGGKSTDVRVVNIPAGAVSGARYVIGMADADEQVSEAEEKKNIKALKITVQ
jgi:subtilase family serine protease